MNVSRKLIAGLVVALALVGSGAASGQSDAETAPTAHRWCCA